MVNTMDEQLLTFFKAFCDPSRIRIAARLLDGSATIEEIARTASIRASEAPRHLHGFEELGLLVQEGDRFRMDRKALERLSRETLASLRPAVKAESNDENADEYDRKVVKNYSLPDGRLREIPLQSRKFQAILRHVVTVIEPETRFTEKEINDLLRRFHEDPATLRRGLVDQGMLERERNGSIYWRSVPDTQAQER